MLFCNYTINGVSFCVFVFKQKTAYEMRISDWSSDVCSSDLRIAGAAGIDADRRAAVHALGEGDEAHDEAPAEHDEQEQPVAPAAGAHIFDALLAVFNGRCAALQLGRAVCWDMVGQ